MNATTDEVNRGIHLRRSIYRALELGRPFLLSGPHGIGKTAALLQWGKMAQDRFTVKYIPLAGLSREDLVMPFPGEKHGEKMVVYLMHEMLDDYDEETGTRKPIVLILDEFNRHSDGQIYNALLELTQVHSMAGKPINLHCIVGLANPSDDTRYFNAAELEQTVIDRFHLYFYADGYELGADSVLVQKYPDTAPAMIDWYYSLPKEKRWLVPPRRQEIALQAYHDGFSIRDVFPRDVDLPVDLLIHSLNTGNAWTVRRLAEDPNAAIRELQANPGVLPLFFALLRAVEDSETARAVSPIIWQLYPPIRSAILEQNRELWTPIYAERGAARRKETGQDGTHAG